MHSQAVGTRVQAFIPDIIFETGHSAQRRNNIKGVLKPSFRTQRHFSMYRALGLGHRFDQIMLMLLILLLLLLLK